MTPAPSGASSASAFPSATAVPNPYEPVLNQSCPCGSGRAHEPVLTISLPVNVTALSRLAVALDRMLKESGRHGVFMADGKHPANVIYAVTS